MKPQFTRRTRSRQVSRAQDAAFFGKEQQGAGFFEPAASPVFFSAAQPAAPAAIQRKCEKCEEDDKAAKPQAAAAAGAMPKMAAEKPEPKQAAAHEEHEKDKKLMKKESGEASPAPTAKALAGTEGSGGNPLPDSANTYFSDAIGYDFSSVRIHTGSEADRSAKALRAKAYTIGQHIVFREGQFHPDSSAGQWLLAHELTHVAQQGGERIHRQAEAETPAAEEVPEMLSNSGSGPIEESTTIAYGNCANVSVQGRTSANYSNSHDFSSTGTRSTGCEGCAPANCVTMTGTITSTFNANPSVSLPSVPGGLNECETAAVQSFINGTLSAHEQEHVAAFNTYIGTVQTPYTYTGCAAGEAAYVAGRHRSIESARKAASDAASAALDPFNPAIPCNCPDPAPPAAPAPTTTQESE